MFTEPVSAEQVRAYERLLGVRVISREVLGPGVDRNEYLASARSCKEHVFLDPDTGIRLSPISGKTAPAYLFADELVALAEAQPGRLTLVFDQSLARGAERPDLEHKLSKLTAKGIHCVAYLSHAGFVLAGRERSLVNAAFEDLGRNSGLPSTRFLKAEP
jgi:hypothetical protein